MTVINSLNCKNSVEARIKEQEYYEKLQATLNIKYSIETCDADTSAQKQLNIHNKTTKHLKIEQHKTPITPNFKTPITPKYLNEEYLFKNKIKEWESQYKDCLFTLLKIPSSRNHCDNTLLVVVKSALHTFNISNAYIYI